jgi:hypothetical protein
MVTRSLVMLEYRAGNTVLVDSGLARNLSITCVLVIGGIYL